MTPSDDKEDPDIAHRVDLLAARLAGRDGSFAEASGEFKTEYRDLLHAISRLGPQYAFDREGRPAAIDAVRQALPLMERDLFDAILEDHACEVAAVEEAIYRVALTYGRGRPDTA